jgi:hypothetical protein
MSNAITTIIGDLRICGRHEAADALTAQENALGFLRQISEQQAYEINQQAATIEAQAREIEALRADAGEGLAPLPAPDLQTDPCSADGTQTDYYTAGTVRRLLVAEREACEIEALRAELARLKAALSWLDRWLGHKSPLECADKVRDALAGK